MKYNLVGVDGNAFAVMGYVVQCMKKENMTAEEIKAYKDKAMSDDYNNLLATSFDMIERLNDKREEEFSDDEEDEDEEFEDDEYEDDEEIDEDE